MSARGRLLILLLVLTVLAVALPLERLDKASDTALNDSLKLAAGTYATARIVNGVVSVVQESQLSLQPGGVGVSLAAGQVLDPLNDATERVADLAILALGLLGTLRLLSGILAEPLNLLLPLAGGLAMVLCVLSARLPSLNLTAGLTCRAFLWLVLVKATVPLMLGISVWVDQTQFTPQIERGLATLAFVNEVEEIPLTPPVSAENGGWFDWLSDAKVAVEARVASVVRTTHLLGEHFDDMMDALTDLFTAYVGKLVIDVFLLPLAVLWFWRSAARDFLAAASPLGRGIGHALRPAS